jgi:penicillin-binding protein 2
LATPVRPPRRVSLPRRRPLVEPISSAGAPFHRSGSFYLRVGALGVVAAAVLGILALRAWSLQVLQGPSYTRLATQQAYRTVDLPGARGAIVDRRGRLLAGTTGRLVVTADRTTLGRLDSRGNWSPSADGLAQLRKLARVAKVPTNALVARIVHDVARSPYAPAVVLPRPTRALAFYLSERSAAYPSFRVTALPARSYPQGGLGSEFLGLLGEVNPKQLAGDRGYARAGQLVGQSGVEAAYDRSLNGGFVRARLPVDSRGQIVGPLRLRSDGRPLPTLKLTIDAKLQRAAIRAIRHGIALAHANGHYDAHAGAAIVMNPKTGALYALASYPDFNQVLAAHDPAYLDRLLQASPDQPSLLDRATQGLYPSGSTFKPIVAEAALSAGLISPGTYLPCTGSLQVGNIVFHNVEAGIDAPLNLEQALSISCDTWFYRLGVQFYYRQLQGNLDIQNWARRLGLGHRTGIDVPGEAAGVVPTPAWLKRTFRAPWQRIWYEGTSVNLSIGQGYLAITPLQLAVAYSALANGGTVVRPHVARSLLGPEGGRQLRFPPVRHVNMPDLWAIRDGLYSAAHDPEGTSSSVFGDFPIPVAGKTGTAETPGGSDHSWYASWAPAGHPRVVVVVLIEHGGFGAEAAAPAARDIYSAFFGLNGKKRRAAASARPR